MSKQSVNRPSVGQVSEELLLQYLERRVMRLLLLYDQRLFRGQFRTFFTGSSLPSIPLLQFYDRHLKLIILSDELLDDILPRIKRQLSLQTNQISLQEEAPTRGEIDWQRTIKRAFNETPDQSPVRFETYQRQQKISVPENLLVIAILLYQRHMIQNTLRKDQQEEILTDQERQHLVAIDDRIDRELASPRLHSLIEEASQSDIDALIERVTTQLRPGISPYRDLLTWWEQFNTLRIGQASDTRHLTLTANHRNERMEGWLYELWIVLEIITLLQEKHQIRPDDLEIKSDQLHFTFTWGKQHYLFRYQRQLSISTGNRFGWEHVSRLQPSYSIERVMPLNIEFEDILIWQEPPLVMSAAYFTDSDFMTEGGDSVQKLLGAMQLQGAHSGALFSPLLSDPPSDKQCTGVVKHDRKMYTNTTDENTSIYLYKITPDMPVSVLHERLYTALQYAVECLPEREKPTCHGIMLDADNVNAYRDHLQPYNVLCPKPHISPNAFDLVNRDKHCLKDPRVCHAFGQAIVPPFVIRAVSKDEMIQQTSDLRARSDDLLREIEQSGNEEKADQLRNHIFIGVGRTIEQYVRLHGNTATIEDTFETWIFGEYWKKHPRCLSEETRNILLSGEYVWYEYQQTPSLADWAAPAIQYCRALENELKRRIHDYYPESKRHYPDIGQYGFDVPHNKMTLGSVEAIYRFKDKNLQGAAPNDRKSIKSAQHNWALCEVIVNKSKSDPKAFEAILQRMLTEKVSSNRNQLAHGGPISQSLAIELHDTILGRKGKQGILFWLTEHLEPTK